MRLINDVYKVLFYKQTCIIFCYNFNQVNHFILKDNKQCLTFLEAKLNFEHDLGLYKTIKQNNIGEKNSFSYLHKD